ncbi:hypothetical protein TRVL_10116 [Trypanosoma vivax]|nr:hypothetical protein TRVL_10116 [Trypanosoma vivax]
MVKEHKRYTDPQSAQQSNTKTRFRSLSVGVHIQFTRGHPPFCHRYRSRGIREQGARRRDTRWRGTARQQHPIRTGLTTRFRIASISQSRAKGCSAQSRPEMAVQLFLLSPQPCCYEHRSPPMLGQTT